MTYSKFQFKTELERIPSRTSKI